MKLKFLLLYSWFIRTLLFFLPEVEPIMRFRGFLYGLGMKECGKNFRVTSDAIMNPLQSMVVGENVFIGNGTFIVAGDSLTIGSNVLIGPRNIIVAGNHTYENGSYYGKPRREPIVIGDGSWICANCTITAGTIIPSRSIVAPNSTFGKKSIGEPDCLYAANSIARQIKKLPNKNNSNQ